MLDAEHPDEGGSEPDPSDEDFSSEWEYAPDYGVMLNMGILQLEDVPQTEVTVRARFVGPEPSERVMYTWYADGAPMEGVSGPECVVTPEMLGPAPKVTTIHASVMVLVDGAMRDIGMASCDITVGLRDRIVMTRDAETTFGAAPVCVYALGIGLPPQMGVNSFSGEELNSKDINIRYEWTDEEGDLVGTDICFRPTYEQLGHTRGRKTFTCTAIATIDGEPAPVFNSPLDFTVDLYVTDITVVGPDTVRSGSTIDITVSAPGVDGMRGKVEVKGLEIIAVEGSTSSTPDHLVLDANNGDTTAVYMCQVTASPGEPAWFSVMGRSAYVPGLHILGAGSGTWSAVAADVVGNCWPMLDSDNYELQTFSPSHVLRVGQGSYPVLSAFFTGPTTVKDVRYAWYVDDRKTPLPGQNGNLLRVLPEYVGRNYAIKTITATATGNIDGTEVTFEPVTFTVLIAPIDGFTLLADTGPGNLAISKDVKYIPGISPNEPVFSVAVVGDEWCNEQSFTWTDEEDNVVGHGMEFAPDAAQLGTEKAVRKFRCHMSAEYQGNPITVYHSPVEFTVHVVPNDFSIKGPATVKTGETIEIVVGATCYEGMSGSVHTTGLKVKEVKGAPLADTSNFVVADALGGTTAVYVCEVAARPGHTVSFAVEGVTAADGTQDIPTPGAEWSAKVTGAPSTPSPRPTPVPDRPYPPDGSGSLGGGAVYPPVTHPDPVPAPTPEATQSPTPTNLPEPTAAVELNGNAPKGMAIVNNPYGGGTVITGVPISNARNMFTVSDLAALIQVPEGGRVQILDASGSRALSNEPAATGMVARVLDSNGVPVAQSTIVVPGDVIGTGRTSLTQLVTIAKAYIGEIQLSGPYELAADLDGGGRINLTDLVMAAVTYAKNLMS